MKEVRLTHGTCGLRGKDEFSRNQWSNSVGHRCADSCVGFGRNDKHRKEEETMIEFLDLLANILIAIVACGLIVACSIIMVGLCMYAVEMMWDK